MLDLFVFGLGVFVGFLVHKPSFREWIKDGLKALKAEFDEGVADSKTEIIRDQKTNTKDS